ncbi:uncharacterized protein A4U43_C08F25330 [Asparagus officinalis]|nr:uncharacterized protein A4U43_C08F25330 [Asparagus officinalis]
MQSKIGDTGNNNRGSGFGTGSERFGDRNRGATTETNIATESGLVEGLMRWVSLTLNLFKIGVTDGIQVGVELEVEMRCLGILALIRSRVTIGGDLKREEVFSDVGAIWEDMGEKITTTIGVRRRQNFDFSRCQCGNPHKWLAKPELYFSVLEVERGKRLEVVSFCLVGHANSRWRWLKGQYEKLERKRLRWTMFVDEFMMQ